MKKLLTILIIPLCLPLLCYSQAAPKNTSRIQIKNVGFSTAVRHVIEAGYIIAKIDSNYHTLSTEPKVSKGNIFIAFHLYEKDSVITVRGTYEDPDMKRIFGVETKNDPIVNKGMKGSPMKNCFAVMESFAKSFGKDIEYQVGQP